MTKEEERLFHQFEAKVRTLVEKYRALRKENEELYALIDEQENKLKSMVEREKSTEQLLNDYKAGRMLELTSGDMDTARKRVASLIREVDKCIALINV